jgi:hypothetical protein
MDSNKLTFYDDWHVFEDVILCAFRYAITRHTYVVDEITSWIKKNNHLLSKRMVNVMKKDLDNAIEDYDDYVAMNVVTDIDLKTLTHFKEWLLDFEKGYGEVEEDGR